MHTKPGGERTRDFLKQTLPVQWQSRIDNNGICTSPGATWVWIDRSHDDGRSMHDDTGCFVPHSLPALTMGICRGSGSDAAVVAAVVVGVAMRSVVEEVEEVEEAT